MDSTTRLILLPGMDGTGLLLEPFLAALGPGFDVKVVRYPDQETWGYAELELAARAALPETGPFFILGESFSGPLAVRLAAAHPGRVMGLVLCASFIRNPRPALSWLKPFVRVLPLSIAPTALIAPWLLGARAPAPMRFALAKTLARISAATLKTRLRAAMEADVSAAFSGLDMPVLYLRAGRDRIVPRTASELAVRLNPRTRIIEIGAPHFVLQTAPAQAAQAIVNFAVATRNEDQARFGAHVSTMTGSTL